ncbi:MAG TPA: hypothetical protein VMT17_03570 [Anaeromyxobacteraceae bacterium]|nr:hypothetical protein [Anaeromyxobacteraceae bacterium]
MLVLATALALALAAQPAQYDTVLLSNGGVLRGMIVEDVPGQDVALQMPDGTIRKIPRADIAVLYYAGAQPAEAPPPEAPPRETPPSAPPELEGLSRWQFAVALAADFPLGSLSRDMSLSTAVTPQIAVELEAAYRIVAPVEVGAYLRIAGGSSQTALNQYCTFFAGWCDTLDLGAGLFGRYSFRPRAVVNPWVSLGFGVEWLDVSNDGSVVAFDFTGWELALSGGVDWRLGQALGIGLYVQGRLAEFLAFSAVIPSPSPVPPIWGGPALHGWFEVGTRFVFGP